MEQSISERLYEAYARLVELSYGGNVQLWNRREISGTRMRSAGWTDVPEDSYATVYSSTFSNENETIVMNFTPIRQDGVILTPSTFFDYCYDVIDGATDSQKLKIGRTYSSVDDAVDAAIESHEVSEVFYELRDAPKEEISALDFLLLKERVKNECARRKYNGSVASYASSTYDYSVQPVSGSLPLPEHFNKIIVPMNAMINTGRTQVESENLVEQIYELGDSMTTLESIDFTAASSGCKASCTGLCQGTCASACTTGCTGACKGTCKGTCTGGCGSNCAGTCWAVCFVNCDTYCTDACDSVCAFSCTADCTGGCKGGCLSGCMGACKGGVQNDPL